MIENSNLTTPGNKFLASRLLYFKELLRIYSDFSIWNEQQRGSWQPISTLDLNELIKDTYLHREILPNEWVFDIDGDDWASVRELALALEALLSELNISFNRWSSGNYLHYHVFFDDSEIVQIKTEWYKKLIDQHFRLMKKKEIWIWDLVELVRTIHRRIPLVLIERLPKLGGASIDLQKFIASRCLIRAEGSINTKTFCYKTYLDELPREQPLIRASWQVKFPERIAIWKPEVELYDALFLIAYDRFVKPEIKLEIKCSRVGKREVAWIERILQSTFSDGRKRLLDLVILPYLITVKGMDSEQALNLALDWALRSHNVEPIKINNRVATPSALKNYIEYRAKRIERIRLKPLSRESIANWFSDCPEIFKVLNAPARKVA